MGETRVLIVDDDDSMLRMLEYSLQKLGPDFEIFTAKDMTDAVSKIEERRIDLVITDYMMPGMTGVDLARAVHRLSPDTQIVLMTAYGTSKLRDTSDHIGFDGFLDKPFDIDKVREIILDTIKQVKLNTVPTPPLANEAATQLTFPEAAPTVNGLLEQLLINAGARAVLLINTAGDPLKIIGQIEQNQAKMVATLVVTNFLQSSELSSLLGNKKTFRSGFYEGDSDNIYICTVNEGTLLGVIFDVKLRPGVVWFYTKQTAASLLPLL